MYLGFKKNSLLIVFFFCFGSLFAQTDIAFFNGTWAELLAEAKRTNKPVFVDVYTSWCGPCKQMAKNVFTQKLVADKFNTSFINYKLDAEKGEGVQIAKKFQVSAYPTYLFVNGNGDLVYRSLGSMPAEKFITEGNIALNEFSDPKPLAVWEEEYQQNKNDATFLLDYLKKRKKQRLNSADLLDQYFIVAGKEAVMQSDIFSDLTVFMNMNTDGPMFQFFKNEYQQIAKLIEDRYKRKFFVDVYLVVVAKNDVDRAILKEDEKLLIHICDVLESLPADDYPIKWRSYDARMKYFTQTKNPKQLQAVLKLYAPEVMGYDLRKIYAKDSLAIANFDRDVASGKLKFSTTEAMESARLSRSAVNLTNFAYRIRELSKAVFQIDTDQKNLTNALAWINKGMEYSNNFTMYEAKAGLLFKLKKIKEAIAVQEEGLKVFKEAQAKLSLNNEKALIRMEENLAKMQKGEPTWTVMADEVAGKISSKKNEL